MKSEKLITGLKWSFLERASVIGLQLILEVILARLLNPEDYGLLGMIVVVIALGNVIVDGGFSAALIHYQDRNEADYAVVFYLSILLGILCFSAFYFSAPIISKFYNKDLTLMIRVLSFYLLMNAIGVIYRAKLSIELNFKKQTVYSVIAIIISGCVGIFMAIKNFGVWALIAQLITYSFFYNLFLLLNYRYIPPFLLTKEALQRVFGFGSRIFLSSVIQALYFNTYPVILGKMYTATVVGLYTKANQLSIQPAGILSSVLQRVLFPYLSVIQSNKDLVYHKHYKFLKLYALSTVPIFVLLIFFTKPIVLLILSEKWLGITAVLQLLFAAGALSPIISLNMNIFQVIGKSKLFLRIEITIKILGIFILIMTLKHGLTNIVLGILFNIFIQFVFTSIAVSAALHKKKYELFLGILSLLILNAGLFFVIYLINTFVLGSLPIMLFLGCLFLIMYYFLINYYYREEMVFIKNFMQKKLK